MCNLFGVRMARDNVLILLGRTNMVDKPAGTDCFREFISRPKFRPIMCDYVFYGVKSRFSEV